MLPLHGRAIGRIDVGEHPVDACHDLARHRSHRSPPCTLAVTVGRRTRLVNMVAFLALLSRSDTRPAVAWAMTKGAYCLSDIDWPVVRLYCPQCHRHAQFKRSTLLDRF